MRSNWDPFNNSQIKADLKGRSIRGGMLTLAGQAITFILNIVRIFVLARLLTPKDFGLIAMVLTITSFLMILKDAGLSMATVQRKSVTHDQVSSLFWVNLAIGCLLGFLLLLLSPAIAWFYREPELWRVSAALSVTFPLSSLLIQHEALLKRHMRFDKLLFMQVAGSSVSLVVAVTCVKIGMGYWALVMSLIATPLISVGLIWILVPWLPGKFRRGVGCMEMIRFGGHLTLDSFFKKFLEIYPELLVGRIYSASALGFYSKAKQLLLVPLAQALAPFQAVAVPVLSRLVDEPDRYCAYFHSQWILIRCFIVPVFCCSIVMYDWITDIALGPGWESVQTLFLLSSIGAMFNFGIWPVTNMMITQGRTWDVLKLSFVRVPLRVCACSVGAFYSLELLIALDALATFFMVLVLVWVGGRSGPVDRNQLLSGYVKYIVSLFIAISLGWMSRLSLIRYEIYEPILIVLVLISCLLVSGLVVLASGENRKVIGEVVAQLTRRFAK